MSQTQNKHPIILLHGWGMNQQAFHMLPSHLANHPITLIELPGHGDAPLTDNQWQSWIAYLDKQVTEPSIIAGWSLGGLLASDYASIYSDKVAGLITIASASCFVQKPSWRGIKPEVLAQFADSLTENPQLTIERFLALQAMGSEHQKQDIKQIKQAVLSRPLPNFAALNSGLSFLNDIDLREKHAKIDLPWLRLWGKLDALVPLKQQQYLAEQPNITDVIFAKASHAPFISHPRETIEKIEQWLTSQTFT